MYFLFTNLKTLLATVDTTSIVSERMSQTRKNGIDLTSQINYITNKNVTRKNKAIKKA